MERGLKIAVIGPHGNATKEMVGNYLGRECAPACGFSACSLRFHGAQRVAGCGAAQGSATRCCPCLTKRITTAEICPYPREVGELGAATNPSGDGGFGTRCAPSPASAPLPSAAVHSTAPSDRLIQDLINSRLPADCPHGCVHTMSRAFTSVLASRRLRGLASGRHHRGQHRRQHHLHRRLRHHRHRLLRHRRRRRCCQSGRPGRARSRDHTGRRVREPRKGPRPGWSNRSQ